MIDLSVSRSGYQPGHERVDDPGEVPGTGSSCSDRQGNHPGSDTQAQTRQDYSTGLYQEWTQRDHVFMINTCKISILEVLNEEPHGSVEARRERMRCFRHKRTALEAVDIYILGPARNEQRRVWVEDNAEQSKTQKHGGEDEKASWWWLRLFKGDVHDYTRSRQSCRKKPWRLKTIFASGMVATFMICGPKRQCCHGTMHGFVRLNTT